MLQKMFLSTILVFVLCHTLFSITSATSVSKEDFKKFSEELLKKDNSGISSKVTVNKQGRTNSGSSTDKADKPLLNVDEKALKHPTIASLRAMFDNYDPDVRKAEDVTTGEVQEEDKFLDAVLNTDVMNYTMKFLTDKTLFTGDKAKFKEFLKSTWFTLYSRGHRKKSSSAFEHIFLGEIKANQVSGFHNWIYFNDQESKNGLNYLGWMGETDFGKGKLLRIHFTWNGITKPVGTLFVGTTPELELALYSVCYLAYPNERCDFTLDNKMIFIQTYTFTGPKRQKLIGSAFPGA
ncbi:endoribonuclease Arlr-like isoform X1 [Lycorma delicatula]|uniref:endoribonuclease Arlr-like isoform X1 n=1 Tax=Lycorma delicatula TaxID=130591 RepID=UPI003F512A34